ncbi:DUF2471 domain-containing protein (plasmid) [Paraburkholderia acidicola]|uniref:DUF2471 domain-containing protein n=1 Tax=Paraburkholderia acidicola TaxID=1912599 RepID=A0ABV1LY65_9BURK
MTDSKAPGTTDDIEATRQVLAARRAAATFQRVMIAAAGRRFGTRLSSALGTARSVSWQTLLEIEDSVYGNPAVMSLDSAVLETFPRLRDSRWLPGDTGDEADLNRDEDDMPIVMLIVRSLRDAATQADAE